MIGLTVMDPPVKIKAVSLPMLLLHYKIPVFATTVQIIRLQYRADPSLRFPSERSAVVAAARRSFAVKIA